MNLMHTAHVPAGKGPFPTIVALHGWGASAHDLLGLAPLLMDGQALVLCPQGKVELEVGPGMKGYGWFPLQPGTPPDPREFIAGATDLRAFLDEALAHYPVDREKVILAGFSQGGAMAYEVGLRHPERYAGVAALSTWLPPPLASSLDKSEALAALPVLVIHGTRDPMVEIARGHSSRDALQELGVDLTYREFDMAHEIRHDALRTLIEWTAKSVDK
jgi:phospholipase/carboxylesterase